MFNTHLLRVCSRCQSCFFPTTALSSHPTSSPQCHGKKLTTGNTLLLFALEYLQLKRPRAWLKQNLKIILLWGWRTQTEFSVYYGKSWVPGEWKVNELVTKLRAAQSHKIRYVIASLLGLNTTKIWIEYVIWVLLDYLDAHKLIKTSMQTAKIYYQSMLRL